jgi:hypothetical protein
MATVHFLMLDSESPSLKGSLQHSFVVQDLTKVGGCTFVPAIVCMQKLRQKMCCAVSFLCALTCRSCWC